MRICYNKLTIHGVTYPTSISGKIYRVTKARGPHCWVASYPFREMPVRSWILVEAAR